MSIRDDFYAQQAQRLVNEDEEAQEWLKPLTRKHLMELTEALIELARKRHSEACKFQNLSENLQKQLESTQAHAAELGKLCESLAQNQKTLWQSRHTKTS